MFGAENTQFLRTPSPKGKASLLPEPGNLSRCNRHNAGWDALLPLPILRGSSKKIPLPIVVGDATKLVSFGTFSLRHQLWKEMDVDT